MYHELDAGRRFPIGELTGAIFENCAAVLLPISPQQYRPHLGWSGWFYGGDDFRCLQLVFPDSSGRFPWSSGSSESFRAAQPDLTAGNWSGLHERLAAWRFSDPPNVAVITTRKVVSGDDWIAFVSHAVDDGGWQFLNSESGPWNAADASVVGLGTIVQLDASIMELADLPLGWHASRDSRGSPWRRAKTA